MTWKVWIKTKQMPPNPNGYADDAPLGSMLDWDDYWLQRDKGYEAVEPFEFTDTLTLDYSYRGRSAAVFNMVGSSGQKYVIRLKEMTSMLKEATMHKGRVTGRWGFVKQGANYSLTYRGDDVQKPQKESGTDGSKEVL